jgi:hypothetical protein
MSLFETVDLKPVSGRITNEWQDLESVMLYHRYSVVLGYVLRRVMTGRDQDSCWLYCYVWDMYVTHPSTPIKPGIQSTNVF